MTAMSANTREIDINTLLLRAFQLAGLIPMEAAASGTQWEARAAYGRDILEMVVKAIQSDGNITTDMDMTEVTLEEGVAEYEMPAGTLRVQGLAMYAEDASDIQTQVRTISRGEYQAIPLKDNPGRPTRYYAARGAVTTLFLYMVPDTTGAVLTIQRQRLLGDNTDPSASVDVERSWNKWLMWELAHHFAVAGGQEVQRCGYIRSNADNIYKACKSSADQGVSGQIHVVHDSGVR